MTEPDTINTSIIEQIAAARGEFPVFVKRGDALAIFEKFGIAPHVFRAARAKGQIVGRKVASHSHQYFVRDAIIQHAVGKSIDVMTIPPVKS